MAKEQTAPPKSPAQAVADNAPWRPPYWEDADAIALRAIQGGTADAEQQKRALRWVIEKACNTYDMHFYPGDSGRNTDFALGRAFAGQQIVKLLNINLKLVRRKHESEQT